VTADVPLVLALDDPAATVATAGGKGASLARLARAGLPVPPGFHLTTRAYLGYLAQDGLREPVGAAVSAVDPADPATFEVASRRITELFAAVPPQAEVTAAVAEALAGLAHGAEPVAVRSSATVEDLAGASSAGQYASYLNVRGTDEVTAAVRRCWASLWTPWAIGYRARHGPLAGVAGPGAMSTGAGGPAAVSMAVVVQRFVPADAAGVLFTVDPVTGRRDRVVINANWGLGESVASGQATPDTVTVDRASGAVTGCELGGKEVMTVPDGSGTREQPTPDGQRAAAVLTDAQAGELARAGLAIEDLFGQPVDVEWARAGDDLFVVQARPVTRQPASPSGTVPAGEEWNDSLGGDWLWTNTNLGEAIPDVMTPVTWSFVELFMARAISPPHVPGYRGFGRIGGRFYVNLSMSVAISGAAGVSGKRFLALTEPVFGKLPPGVPVPRARVPRWTVLRMMISLTIANTRRLRAAAKRMPEFLAGSPGRCDRLRADIAAAAGPGALVMLWRDQVQPLYLEASDMLSAAGAGSQALVLVTAPRRLAARVGRDDAALLLSGQQDGAAELASLGPALGLARLARGEIDQAEFIRRYGHRSPHEIEMSVARPAEDSGWIDRQLAAVAGAPAAADALLARQQEARAAAWQRLAGQNPKKVARARTLARRWSAAARAREAARSELVRAMWVLRAWVLRAGELTGRGDGMFFLGWPEILAVLGGDTGPLAAVPARREAYRTYRALPPYPALIRGRFDPVRWAADPRRRTDYYAEHDSAGPSSSQHSTGRHSTGRHSTGRPGPGEPGAVPSGGTVTGFPGAAGVVEGVARVLTAAEDAGQLGDGEILVTTTTNVGWTPVFPRAAAVVTDVGAPLSHAAIVARELGIPAVVGCVDATMRLHTGDRVRVDGGQGTVRVLRRA
jgi:pyruvate,water dikinase